METKDFDLKTFNEIIEFHLNRVNKILSDEKENFNNAEYDFIKKAYRISVNSFLKKTLEALHKNVNKQFSFIGSERFTREKENFFFEEVFIKYDTLVKKLVTEELAKEGSVAYINYIKKITTESLLNETLMNTSSPSSNLEGLSERVANQKILDILKPF